MTNSNTPIAPKNQKEQNLLTVVVFFIIGKEKYKAIEDLPVNKFLRTLYTAANCRFIASSRLKNKALVSFATTTILSLGLILIPLFQLAHLRLSFSVDVLLMIQIFLAVSILVYSIINSKARFNIRAEKLNVCGDKIKKVARDLEAELDKINDKQKFEFDKHHNNYLNIETDIENHTQLDYFNARVKMPNYYEISGLKKFKLFIKYKTIFLFTHFVSFFIVLFELIIILDSLGIIQFLSPLFNGLATKI